MGVDQALVAAAEAYEELFVAALFRPWAVRVADGVRARSGDRALDVACGTGVLTRELLGRVGSEGRVSAIDVAPGMIEVARRLAPQADVREGRAESLPWPDGSFDVVASQFGLMFFGDRVGALREMNRVLAPGGRLAVAVWASADATPAFAVEIEIVERLVGKSAGDALRSPFLLGDPDELERLFEAAGLGSIEIATERSDASFPSVRSLLEADLRGWLPLMGVTVHEAQIERVIEEAECSLAGLVDASGTLTFPATAHVVTATKA